MSKLNRPRASRLWASRIFVSVDLKFYFALRRASEAWSFAHVAISSKTESIDRGKITCFSLEWMILFFISFSPKFFIFEISIVDWILQFNRKFSTTSNLNNYQKVKLSPSKSKGYQKMWKFSLDSFENRAVFQMQEHNLKEENEWFYT